MEIPSNTSNVQPYGSNSGIKFASENDGAQRTSPDIERSQVTNVDQKPKKSLKLEQAMELAREREKLNKLERERMMEHMQEFITSINTGLSFRVDEEAGRDVVTIYEASTGDIIRQIPDEEMLEILRRLREQTARYSSGLVDAKV